MYKIADFVIGIKNAAKARRREVILPYSKINKEIGQVLVREKFLEYIKEEVRDNKKILFARVGYYRRSPMLTDVSIVSKPSLRVYTSAGDINKIGKRGLNTAVLSTSKGVMTGKEARKLGIGGELLFKIW